MADPTENIDIEQQFEKNKVNAYMSKGKTGFETKGLMWRPNTDLALFNNIKWSTPGDKGTPPLPDFNLKDYTWYSELYNSNSEFNDDIGYKRTVLQQDADILDVLIKRTPTIKIRSFKPMLGEIEGLIALFKNIFNISSILFKNNTGIVRAVLKRSFSVQNLSNTIEKTLSTVSFINNIDSGKKFNMIYNGVNAFYRRLMPGLYMTGYTMPFYNSNTYLQSNSGTFDNEGLINPALKEVLGLISSSFANMDILKGVTWNSASSNGMNGSTGYDAINFEFSLFNRTSNDVYRNVRFIHTLIPEALWIQNGIFQIPGSVYDVEIPGRTRYYWCTAQFKCDYQGKTRYFKSYNINDLYSAGKSSKFTAGESNAKTGKNIASTMSSDKYDDQINNKEEEKRIKVSEKNTHLDNLTQMEGETLAEFETRKTALTNQYNSKIKELDDQINKLKDDKAKELEPQVSNITNVSGDIPLQYTKANFANFSYLPIRDLNYIPDSYKINCTLNSMLPNNLNTYLYGMFESKNFVPEYGDGIDSLVNSMIRGFVTNIIKEGFKKAEADAPEGEVKEQLTKALNEINQL